MPTPQLVPTEPPAASGRYRHLFGLIGLVFAMLVAPPTVFGQSSGSADAGTTTERADAGSPDAGDAGPAKDDQDQLTRRFASPVGDGTWRVQLGGADSSKASKWHLTLALGDEREPIVDIALPDWAGPPDYIVTVEAAEVADNDAIVLVDVEPNPETPNGSTEVTLQVAWWGRPESDAADPSNVEEWNWTMINRTQYSTLDGGSKLTIRREEGEAKLVERRQEASTTFCGPSARDDVSRNVFDTETGKFAKSLNIEQYLKGARTVEGSYPDDPIEGPFTRGVYQWYWATSDIHQSSDTSTVVRPMELGDRRSRSAWVIDGREGVRGEYATANVTDSVPVTGFYIVPGYTAGERGYRKSGRPKKVLLSFSEGTTYVVDLPNVEFDRLTEKRGLLVELPEPVTTNCLTALLLEAHPPDRPPEEGEPVPVAISEFTPVTAVDAQSAAETAQRVVDRIASEPDLRKRKRLAHIASGLSQELIDAVDRALEETEGVRRRRIIPLLANLPSNLAVPRLINFLQELSTEDVEYRAIKRSLAVHGKAAADPLADLVAETDPKDPKHVDMVRLLGRVGQPSHLTGLTDDFGRGERFVRNERIRAVASAGEGILPRLFSIVTVEGATPKGRDALKAAYLIGKRGDRQTLQTVSNASTVLELLRETDDRRTLMLAFQTAKHFQVRGLIELIEQRFLDYGDPLVRKSAMASLARYDQPKARRLLERGLEDNSPDVRLGAINALGRRADVRRSTEALLDYIEREEWRPGLRQALDLLAEIDIPKTQTFFETLIDQQRTTRTAAMAANSLSRADRSIDAELAKEIALDPEADRQLRVDMIDLLGVDDSDTGEIFLLTLLNPAELSRYVDDSQLRRQFERRAVLSLGRRQSADARRRLLKMAKTGSDRKLRQHALRALGFYSGEDLVKQLEAWRPEAPPELRTTIDQTIRIIENRSAIKNVQGEIDATMEAEESPTKTDDPSREEQRE